MFKVRARFLLCIFFVIPACSSIKRSKKKPYAHTVLENKSQLDMHNTDGSSSQRALQENGNLISGAIRWQEAKFSDVPLPFNALPIESYNDIFSDEGSILAYQSKMSHEDIIDFYQREMEHLGWQQVVSVKGLESLLQFEKPGRFCTISVRPSESKIFRYCMNTKIIIFTGKKT